MPYTSRHTPPEFDTTLAWRTRQRAAECDTRRRNRLTRYDCEAFQRGFVRFIYSPSDTAGAGLSFPVCASEKQIGPESEDGVSGSKSIQIHQPFRRERHDQSTLHCLRHGTCNPSERCGWSSYPVLFHVKTQTSELSPRCVLRKSEFRRVEVRCGHRCNYNYNSWGVSRGTYMVGSYANPEAAAAPVFAP